ncbi:MAG: SDR family NAD(P)-dependent oxidoreductase [Myxococcales bacterium]|nr:SDR family NAD(P)-dependent oxidoreductase [Myxococcales bacterium]
MAKTILVTGAAGFIGSHVSQALTGRGDRVVGLDNLDPYYDPAIKRRNLAEVRAALPTGASFTVVQGDIRNRELVEALFARQRFDAIVHLAGLASVRYSIGRAARYNDVNVGGSIHLLDAAIKQGETGKSPNFIFASTSSVYGDTERIPFLENDPCDRPLAPYPASKRAVELLGYASHNAHGLDFTALRFFTVYGPRNRPDMMAHMLLDSVTKGRELELFAGGQLKRDWTYVDDIVQGVVAAVDRRLGYQTINLGRGEPVLLADFVEIAEKLAGGRASVRNTARPAADVEATFANIDRARELLGYAPSTSVAEGMGRVWEWYRGVYGP